MPRKTSEIGDSRGRTVSQRRNAGRRSVRRAWVNVFPSLPLSPSVSVCNFLSISPLPTWSWLSLCLARLSQLLPLHPFIHSPSPSYLQFRSHAGTNVGNSLEGRVGFCSVHRPHNKQAWLHTHTHTHTHTHSLWWHVLLQTSCLWMWVRISRALFFFFFFLFEILATAEIFLYLSVSVNASERFF